MEEGRGREGGIRQCSSHVSHEAYDIDQIQASATSSRRSQHFFPWKMAECFEYSYALPA